MTDLAVAVLCIIAIAAALFEGWTTKRWVLPMAIFALAAIFLIPIFI